MTSRAFPRQEFSWVMPVKRQPGAFGLLRKKISPRTHGVGDDSGNREGASALRAYSGTFEPWQDLIAEIWQLIRVIDERNRDAAHTGPRQRDEVVGDPLRVSGKRQPAHAMHLE